jgi:hypothetical protein
VPSRAATINSANLGHEGWRDLLRRALGRNPLDVVGIVVLLIAAGAILANALYRQPGPHPAPIFSVKPRPVATEPAEIVPPLPRTRPAVAAAPKPETVASSQAAPVDALRAPVKPETPAPRASARPDPIADIIAGPSPRVTALQRALNDFGYGPLKATGNYGSETIAAVKKFERDRKMPVTGQISPRLLQELSVLTGKPIE